MTPTSGSLVTTGSTLTHACTLGTGRRVSDLSDLICQQHAYCRKKSSRNRKTETEPSRQIRDERTQTSPTHFGREDIAKLYIKDTLALPIRLNTQGTEVLQHGKREASIYSTSDDNPTIGQRLSIYRRGEKAKWKDTLRISSTKYHVRNGGDPT